MNILILGQGPLPPEMSTGQSGQLAAPGIRAWHFGCALHQAGHKVWLVSIHSGTGKVFARYQVKPGLTLLPIYETDLITGETLAGRLKEFQADAAVAVSAWPSYLAALYLPVELPLWADLFGSPLAEGQAKAYQTRDDADLEPFAWFERTVMRRADVLSAVSNYQQYATIGALATHGRLNRHSDGYRFVYTIPATLDPQTLPSSEQPVIRGKVVPLPSFIVLWSGGFNTWTDVKTLYNGLVGAMAACPELHFVATGGSLGSHDNRTFASFQHMVAASPYRERFHLLGWMPYDSLHNYYLEADAGIILDRWSYEGVLGSRTRLLDWLLYGLPAVVTVTAELTEELVKAGLAFSFPHGDSVELARLLTELVQDRHRLFAAAQDAPAYVRERFSYLVACRPLLVWAAAPKRAPDAGHKLPDFFDSYGQVELEKQLVAYRAQLEIKNTHIKEMETWAYSLEDRLKSSQPRIKLLLNQIFNRLTGKSKQKH